MRHRPTAGFTLFELLVVLGIIGVMWGVGMTFMPRLLSGGGPDDMARRLAGAGLEARQMAMLQQRPWELLLDLDEGIYYTAPLGAVSRRALRGAEPGEAAAGVLLRTEKKQKSMSSLRRESQYDIAKTYTPAEDDADIRQGEIAEDTRIVRVQSQDILGAEGGRVSIIFSPRGICRPTVVWLEDAEETPHTRRTLYFPGLLPPKVERGRLLTDADGNLYSAEDPS